MKRQTVFALAVVLVAAGPLAQGVSWAGNLDLVVLESEGTNMKPGDSVDGAKAMTLAAGQAVTLIAESGQVIRLSGPFAGVPVAAESSKGGTLSASLQQLLSAPAATSSSLGASRDSAAVVNLGDGALGAGASRSMKAGTVGGVLPAEGGPPEPWLVDVTTSGHRCVLDTGEVVFWRWDRKADADVTVALAGGDWSSRTRWPAGYAKLAAPEAMPRREGAVFTVIAGGGTATTSNITLHVLPHAVTAAPVLAAWMVEKGCPGQAAALLRTMTPGGRAP